MTFALTSLRSWSKLFTPSENCVHKIFKWNCHMFLFLSRKTHSEALPPVPIWTVCSLAWVILSQTFFNFSPSMTPIFPGSHVFTFWWMTIHSFQSLCQLLLLSPCREADGKSMLSLLGCQWEIQTMQLLTYAQKPSSWSHQEITIKTQTQFALLSQSISHLPGTLPCGPRKAYCMRNEVFILCGHMRGI